MENDSLVLNLKIGIIKDLYEQKLITQIQMEAAINLLRQEGSK